MKTKILFLIATVTSLLSAVGDAPLFVAAAEAQEVYRDSGFLMGYISPDQTVSTVGYDSCFTSVGNYLWVHSDNSANKEPFFQVRATNNRVAITRNRYADGKGVYVCHNSQGATRKITAGYVVSGTSIGSGLTCVVSVANFQKRVVGVGGTGTVGCSYSPTTGVVTATQSGGGIKPQCGYVCADPSSVTTTSLFSLSATERRGSRNIGARKTCALGINSFFSKRSTMGFSSASYNPTTGVAVLGFTESDNSQFASFSYLCTGGTQCADGIDNDGDGLIDRNDPGCWTNPLDPTTYDPNRDNEGARTSQCQDGLDNDSDGAIDYPADFSCSSRQDNDETNTKAQCQDGLDNDSDGAIDFPADFSCSSKQDNDEAGPKSQCQNGGDDDQDGNIDLADPGCSGPQDNNESDEVVTAYKVTPIAECVDALQNGNLLARFGYKSDEASSVTIPIGVKNNVAPGNADAGQPTTFLRGAFSNVFTLVVPVATPQSPSTGTSSVIRWTLGDVTVEASAQTQRCAGGEITCDENNNKPTLSQLDHLASRQRTTVRLLANRIRSVNGSTFSDLADSYETKAQNLYLEQWQDIWSSFPQVSKSCTGCAAIDTTSSITEITNRSKKLLRLTKQAAATLKKARRGNLRPSDEARVTAGTTLYNRAIEVSKQLPRFNSQCG